ncbi:MAG TPA: glycoside hydrolase family 3 N-terminal domain-containing protein [Terriglobales bacterium]|nr:glycoside hydrolase family 3 N-terminal domain-containing protein [Terriglobales bacterium]
MQKLTKTLLFLLLSMPVLAADKPQKAEAIQSRPVQLNKDGHKWVEKTLKKLSLEEKVGQMINIRYFTDFQNFDSDTYKQIRDQLQKYHIGSMVLTVHVDGPILLKNPPLEVAAVANQLQRDSTVPLLMAADFERGLDSRVKAVPAFPDAMAFGAIGNTDYAEKFGAITAEESRAIGIQWNLFPIADVNINPANPIINTRSFGENPDEVGALVAAFIKGSHEHGMLTAAKHFPGHGDTGTDSHLGVARVEGDLARLQKVELPPFKKAISADVDSIMVAHVSAPALDPDPNKVATISHRVITDILKVQLGFQGVVVTDAMDMRGLTSLYPPGEGNPMAKAAVDAVKAGNDVILWPTDLDGAFNGIINAVKKGEISEAQIDASVKKILEMKASVGLDKNRFVDLQQVSYLVSKPEDLQFAQQVADDAVTLVRDNKQVLPLQKLQVPATEAEIFQANVKPSNKVVVIVITDAVRGEWGQAFETAFKQRRADATFFHVDNTVAAVLTPEVLQAVKDAEKVVVAAYVVPTPAKQVMVDGKLVNTVSLDQATGELLRQVLEMAAPKTAVVALGNPYVAQNFLNVQTYICTYSNATSSELSAVKGLFGELQSHGKLPVTLPGIAERGFSLPWPSAATSGAVSSGGHQ